MSEENIDQQEKYWIEYYRTIGKCYNLQDGGQPEHLERFISLESRKRVGEINRQRMVGSKLSDETKAKMSETRKGKHPNRKNDLINREQATAIKQMLMSGLSSGEIMDILNIPYRPINGILSINTWKTAEVEGWEEFYANRKRGKGQFTNGRKPNPNQKTEKQILEIYQIYDECNNISKTAKILHVNRETVVKYLKLRK